MSLDQRVFAWRGNYHVDSSTARAFTYGDLATDSLAGLRLGVKDLFHIAGLPTGAGNPDWLASHPIPKRTSPVVSQLRDAGAELVGKTQTDELAYSLNGLNAHYGAPVNPKSPTRLPGGSSSGSAVAVAAEEIDIGLGTDTGGSIRVPASYNGLFGIRTSHGLISCDEMVPLAPLFDTVGWLTRDANTLLKVGTVLLPAKSPKWNPTPLKIGIVDAAMNRTRLWTDAHDGWLIGRSAVVEHKRIAVDESWFNRASNCFRILQGRDIWRVHGEWIREQNPTFAPDIHARFEWASQLTSEQQSRAEAERLELKQDIANWFEGVDLLLLPTTPGPSPLLGATAEWMDNYRSQLMGLTAPAGLAGLPQVHLPVLSSEGAPMGISLLAPKGFDLALLQLAAGLEYSQLIQGDQ